MAAGSDPRRIDYDVGKDIYGRRVTLTWSVDYCGRRGFSIVIDPIDQRDDGARITHALTAENLQAMASATRNHK